jgi:hypothetical protein
MESELLYTKERLALERRAQQNLKAVTGDSTGAAWAHMWQRVSRAEREARAARRMVVAVCCVSLAGVAGVITIARPWSAAHPPAMGIRSRGSAGEASIRAWDVQDQHLIATAPSPASRVSDRAPSSMLGPSDSPGPPPGNPSGTQNPNPASLGNAPETGLAESSPHPVRQPVLEQRAGFRQAGATPPAFGGYPAGAQRADSHRGWVGSGSRRAARSAVRWRPRSLARSRRPSRYLGRSRYWRVLRVSRSGSATHWFVDHHGHWWKARCVPPPGVGRGQERKRQ